MNDISGKSKKTPEVQQNTSTTTTEEEAGHTNQEALPSPVKSGKGKRPPRKQKANEIQKVTPTSKAKRTGVTKKISDEENPNDVVVKTESK